jgi:tRNA(fMet)-specific endonuclease VapC
VLILDTDTDAISVVQRGGEKGSRYDALAGMLDAADEDVFVTVISLDEQLHGAFKEIASSSAAVRLRGYRRLRDLVADYAGRPMLDYDDAAEAIFQRLKGMKGRPGTKDLRVAAIAISLDATIVTGNVGDFEKIPMLKLRPMPS